MPSLSSKTVMRPISLACRRALRVEVEDLAAVVGDVADLVAQAGERRSFRFPLLCEIPVPLDYLLTHQPAPPWHRPSRRHAPRKLVEGAKRHVGQHPDAEEQAVGHVVRSWRADCVDSLERCYKLVQVRANEILVGVREVGHLGQLLAHGLLVPAVVPSRVAT